MTIYHGGYCEVTAPHIIVGKYTKDFGHGFYCTEMRKQAERWSIKYDNPTLSIYEYREAPDTRILRFDEMTEEWLDFIISCRSGVQHDNDIVVGAMANDQVYNFIIDFMEGIISREAFWALARFKYPTHQIAFCTERSLASIRFLYSEGVAGSGIQRR